MAKTNTTEKTKRVRKGKPISFRPDGVWIDNACEYAAKNVTKKTGIEVEDIDVKKAIFRAGIEPFFKSNNLPTTQEGWEKLLKEAVAEINEE